MTVIINKETIPLTASMQILLFDHSVLYTQALFIHISFPAMTCYYTIFGQILLLMGQLHTLRQHDSTALLPMLTFMLLMAVKVYVYTKLKVQQRERLGEEV